MKLRCVHGASRALRRLPVAAIILAGMVLFYIGAGVVLFPRTLLPSPTSTTSTRESGGTTTAATAAGRLVVPTTGKGTAAARSFAVPPRLEELRKDLGLDVADTIATSAPPPIGGAAGVSPTPRDGQPSTLSMNSRSSRHTPNDTTNDMHHVPLLEKKETAAAAGPIRIDLLLYVLFQKEVNGRMYSNIQWDWLPTLRNVHLLQPSSSGTSSSSTGNSSTGSRRNDSLEVFETNNDSPTPTSSTPPNTTTSATAADAAVPSQHQQQQQQQTSMATMVSSVVNDITGIVGDDTATLVQQMTAEAFESDRTRIAFVAVNPAVKKTFRLLPSQLRSGFKMAYVSPQSALAALFPRAGISTSAIATAPVASQRRYLRQLQKYQPTTLIPVKASHVVRYSALLKDRLLKEWRLPGHWRPFSWEDEGTSARRPPLPPPAASAGGGGEQEGSTNREDIVSGAPGDLNASSSSSAASMSTSPPPKVISPPPRVALRQRLSLDEFGVMRSLYHSGLTLMHTSATVPVYARGAGSNNSTATSRLLAADADGDGIQEWMGIFPSDVRLDVRTIQQVRRRIRQRSLATLNNGRAATGAAAAATSKGNTTSRSGGPKVLFHGRVLRPIPVSNNNNNGENHNPASINSSSSPNAAARPHCCVFFAGAYPSLYLFKNALSEQLLARYNAFFRTNHSLDALCRRDAPDAILESFIVPNALFNKIFPFVDAIIDEIAFASSAAPSSSPFSFSSSSSQPQSESGAIAERMCSGIPLTTTRSTHDHRGTGGGGDTTASTDRTGPYACGLSRNTPAAANKTTQSSVWKVRAALLARPATKVKGSASSPAASSSFSATSALSRTVFAHPDVPPQQPLDAPPTATVDACYAAAMIRGRANTPTTDNDNNFHSDHNVPVATNIQHMHPFSAASDSKSSSSASSALPPPVPWLLTECARTHAADVTDTAAGITLSSLSVPVDSGGGGSSTTTLLLHASSASATDVLERALSMALALEKGWTRLRMPIRHARDFS